MLSALLVFSLLVYGLTFLVADAKIFGCPAKMFYEDPSDTVFIREASVLPWRQVLMRWGRRSASQVSAASVDVAKVASPDGVELLLTCYFCLGTWCGAVVHLSLVGLGQFDPTVPLLSSYPLLSSTISGTVACTFLAAVMGGATCYILDLMVRVFENKVAAQELALEEAEAAADLRATRKLDVVDRDVR